MRMLLVILWRLIFGAPDGNYVGCFSNNEIDIEYDIVDAVEKKEKRYA